MPELTSLWAGSPLAAFDAKDELRLDGIFKTVSNIFKRIAETVLAASPNRLLEENSKKAGKKASEHARKQLRRQFVSSLGIDLYATDDEDAIEGFVEKNVKLIRSVQNQYLHEVEQTILEGLSTGSTVEDLKDRLTPLVDDVGKKAERRAKVIANDQVGKLSQQINRHRQQSVGVKKFIWRTMGDNRVRDSHEDLDGQEFTWAEGANGLYPGDDIMCRCYAEPVIEIDALEDNDNDED